MFIYMFKRTKREERRDKLTLYYYYDYSRLAFVVVENTIMMTGRLVCSVYVCMYRSKLWCDDRRRRRRRSEHFSLFLPFTTRERKPVYGQIFFSLSRRKKKMERGRASKVKVI
jgi:hypothetical protein